MNRSIMLVFLVFIMAAVGGYSFFCIRRLLRFYIRKKDKWMDVVSALLAAALVFSCYRIWKFASVVVLHILGAFFAFDLMAWMVSALWKRFGNTKVRAWKICGRVYQCGVLPFLLAAVLMGYGYYNMQHFVSTTYEISTPKLNSGYHIILITDTHYGTIQDTKLLKKAAEEISSLGADLIILGGDIVEEGTTKESMQEVFRVLGNIQSTYGTYYVYGNHDLQPYTDRQQYTQAELEEAAKQGGVKILRDSYVVLGEEMVLAGRDNAARGGSGRAAVKELLEGADREKYIVMVDHQPTKVQENEEQGVDLMLSGHTHAGQMWPAGTILELTGQYNYGSYLYENLQLIVSSGFTGWGYPMRTQKHCEYVQIFLVPSGES